MSIGENIGRIEAGRGSQVLVFASSQLDIETLPPLYEALRRLQRGRPLDVLFYSRGGVVNAARRIALLLREFSPKVSFLVPHYCESAGTVTALSADEIVAGPLAIFSPVDPLLSAARGGEGGPMAMSAQDLRLFGEMAVEWFGLDHEQACARALTVLCDNIFPSTLTSFYRSTLEVQGICEELLSLHMAADAARRKKIADRLVFGFHSHTYALTRGDLMSLGLPVSVDGELDEPMWSISSELREVIGPASRASSKGDWLDAYVATRHGAVVRRRSEDFPGRWHGLALS